MFIKRIILQNFKCFANQTIINFNYPTIDNNGLNFFVGENNTGKSTIFEAINLVFSGLPKGKSIQDIKHKEMLDKDVIVELEITGDLKNILDSKYHSHIIEDNGAQILRLSRNSKEISIEQNKKKVDMDIKKLGVWNMVTNQYENLTGFDSAFKSHFDIDFIRADTSPDDIAEFGSTTICGKLVSRISEGFKDSVLYKDFEKQYHKVFNEEENSLKTKLKTVGERAEKIFKDQFGAAKINFHFDNLDISSYFKNTRIEIDDGTKTYLDDKGSGMQRAVALTLLQVYIEFLSEDNEVDKPFYFFIDEPELCLHPLAQLKLGKALNLLAKRQQIFLTTHSPYMFKEIDTNLNKVNICTKEGQEVKINQTTQGLGLFGSYSPTRGEINYFAYNLPTVEFHNELYGYIQSKAIDIDEDNYREEHFDSYLKQKLAIANTDMIIWKKLKPDSTTIDCSRTLPTYIRNCIHHPENTHNRLYTSDELKISLEKLLTLII